MSLKVGKSLIEKNGKTKELTYTDVPTDIDGWVDSSKYLPEDFDLVELRMEDNIIESGWAIGSTWDGLYVDSDSKVNYWRRITEKENVHR